MKPSKYEPITKYLEKQEDEIVEIKISELEHVLGFTLAQYSRTQEFWTNETNYETSGSHAQSRAWQRAGFLVEHRLGSDLVRFVRKPT
jgi:hypothetical protein